MSGIERKNYIAGTLHILRALSGAGKTTYIEEMIASGRWPQDTVVCSIDDYMIDKDGTYRFRDYKIKEATELCYLKFLKAILDGSQEGVSNIVIDNRNLQHIDFVNYYVMGWCQGYVVQILSLFDSGFTNEELAARNTHGVPATGKGSIAWSRKKWEGYSHEKLRKLVKTDDIGKTCPGFTNIVEDRLFNNKSNPKLAFDKVEEHVYIP